MHAWEKFVKDQEQELGAETVNKWLKTLTVTRFDACNLFLEAKDAFQAIWFEEHIRQRLQSKLFNNNNKRIKVHLSVANAPSKTKNKNEKKNQSDLSSKTSITLSFDQLDPHCLFENFVISNSNLLTYKVFSEVSSLKSDQKEIESSSYNPIYIHGRSGSGKTHLLMATAEALRRQGVSVMYSRAQTFTDHVVSAIRAGEMSMFRQSYRNSDVLILDDVHLFSRKGATQEEFFHTFNTLHVAGKQIILGANCSPNELELIEPRLVSRFEWGIVLSLEMPSREDLQKILTAKADALNYPLHAKVVDFFLESFLTPKSLIKSLNALILRSHLYSQNSLKPLPNQMTVALAKQLLADLILEEQKAALNPVGIIQGVAEFFGIRSEDILGKAQTREYVLPRQISMHLCRSELKLAYVKIGDLFKKDHSTVISSVKIIQNGIDVDDHEIGSAYRAILKKIKP